VVLMSPKFCTGRLLAIACCWGLGTLWTSAASAQGVTVDQILKYKPVQPGVDYESPQPAEVAQCKVEVERAGKASGWVVYGPAGQILRRFVDTDGDNVVDHWRYYQHGLEVYRDLDTNANNEVDQSRWLNMGGTRWGIDSNEDGKIDRWQRLSAEEASREAIRAMAARDERALSILMVDAKDAQALGLEKQVADEMLKQTANLGQQLQAVLSKSKTIRQGTQWARFDSSLLMPNVIPRESGKAERDLVVYENVMTIVENGSETGFVQIGEMVQVGDVWKLTSVPQPLDGDNLEVVAGGLLMQPSVAALAEGSVQLSAEVQKLIDQLQKLDEAAPGADAKREDMVRYNTSRAKLLDQLSEAADTQEERDLWRRQQIDGIAAAVQMDAFPTGLAELEAIEEKLRRGAPPSPLVPYATFHKLAADYNLKLQSADADDRGKLQEGWVKSLEKFVSDHPKSEVTDDALLQLAVSFEFLGQEEEAKKAYDRLAREHSGSIAANRGAGALRRLNLVGNPLPLSGSALGGGTIDAKSYRGKVLAVVFWATWCKPCTEELPQMIELYKQYQPQGFEIIGVNLDNPGAPVQQYIQQFKVPWKHLAEEGGLESRPAQDFGIITLPTMFLVDKEGRVVSASASLDDLKTQVPELLKK
jgi:thiol-disulfide isomerase/thioredoxin